MPTAALVVEIVSPGDESWQKLPSYAAHDVDEVLILDADKHSVDWLALADGSYQSIEPPDRPLRRRACAADRLAIGTQAEIARQRSHPQAIPAARSVSGMP